MPKSHRLWRACVGALPSIFLFACTHPNPPPPKPPIVELTPEEEKEARATFDRLVARYQAADAKDAFDPAACDELAGGFAKLQADYGELMNTALFNAGAVRERCGQLKQAEALYRQLVAADPKNDAAYNNLGVLALRRGDDQAAMKAFAKAIEAAPTTRAPRNNVAAVLRERYTDRPEDASFDKAEHQAQAVLAVDSSNRRAFENLARIYYDRGRLQDKAYLLASELVASQGMKVLERGGVHSAELWVIKGLIEMERDDPVQAIRAFAKATEVDPDHADAHMNHALIALRFRNWDIAQEGLEAALSDDKYAKDVDAYLALGVAHRGRRDFDAAQAAFNRALEIDDGDPRALFNLGVLHQDYLLPAQEKFDVPGHRQAQKLFKRFATAAEAKGDLKVELAAARHRIKVIDESIAAFEQMAEIEAAAKAAEEQERLDRERKKKELLDKERQLREAQQAAQAGGTPVGESA